MRRLTIGTRGSALALCQARLVQAQLQAAGRGVEVALEAIAAQADRRPEASLAAMSGEGIFVKELEAALLEGRIDVAVHSLKDLPLDTPAELEIAAVPAREEPRDALVLRVPSTLDALPRGARVGTSSLRRKSQLLAQRGDLHVLEIRGNVDTRLRKLDEGQYDAIVVAACGLIRLGLAARITQRLDFSVMLPEPGQGALAVEIRADDTAARELVRALEDPVSRSCVEAERAFLRGLGGGCRVPIAAHASCADNALRLEGAVIAADGRRQIRDTLSGSMAEPSAVGRQLADRLIAQGALELLKSSVA
ncbi:MAG: hydroxymethylbilane synthase [Candidatus Omnitrophica bacterium]|nr:hydroxymethylbilane synthase [Candidatus Omnitrophota bacterium]